MQRYALFFPLFFCTAAGTAFADHGKGSIGGKALSGTTLHEGDWNLSVGWRYERDEPINDARLAQLALAGHDPHSVNWLLETTVAFTYGVSDRLNVGVSIPYILLRDFRAADADPGTGNVNFDEASHVAGLGDMTISGKYLLFGGEFDLSVLVGLKVPTGSTTEDTNDGARLGPDHQPGTGSWDPLVGLAVTKKWESFTLTTSTSLQITTPGAHGYWAGDLFQLNVRGEFQITELGTYPRLWAALELNGQFIGKGRFDGALNADTGGFLLQLSPGLKARLDEHLTLALSVPIPVYQSLYGEQHREQFEILFGISYDH